MRHLTIAGKYAFAQAVTLSLCLIVSFLCSYSYSQAEYDELKAIIDENEQAVPIIEYLAYLRQNVPASQNGEPSHYALLRKPTNEFELCTKLSKRIRAVGQDLDAEAVAAYVSGCLALSEHPALSSVHDRLNKIVGVMKVDWFGIETIECTVLRLGERYLMTARHCFSGHDLMDEAGNISISNVREYVRFYLAARPGLAIKPKAFIENPYYSDPQHRNGSLNNLREQFDYVLIETENIDIPFYKVNLSIPKELDKLVILGVSVITIQLEEQQLAAVGLQTINDRKLWVRALRWDNNPTCVSARVIGACMYHGCQTERKMSGAPIFGVTQGGAITLLGIHTRTATSMNSMHSDYDCPVPSNALALGNGGIALTSEKIHFLEHYRG